MAGTQRATYNDHAFAAANAALLVSMSNPASPTSGDLDGSGITIGFVDYGYDLQHPCLKSPCGAHSRFSVLWDQNAQVLEKAELDRLAGLDDRTAADKFYDPHANYYDDSRARHGAHGTMMASIAAATAFRGYRGLAPGSDLLAVQLALPESGWKEVDRQGNPTWRDWDPLRQPVWDGWKSYGDVAQTVDALDFLFDRSTARGDQALVINMSIGAWAGPHDGRTAVERKIAEIHRRSRAGHGPATAIVLCSGNAGSDNGHISARVTRNSPAVFKWCMATVDRTPNKIEIWYDSRSPLDIRLDAPDGTNSFSLIPGPTNEIRVAGLRVGLADHRSAASGALACARIILHPPYFPEALTGTGSDELEWMLHCATSNPHAEIELHGWLERDDGFAARSYLMPHDEAFTLGGLATAEGAIIVGASDSFSRPGVVGRFPPSSLGPRPWRDRQPGATPHVIAPGHGVWGAKSKSRDFVQTSGTSPAAAITSGALALAFQAALRTAARSGDDPRARLFAVVDRLKASNELAADASSSVDGTAIDIARMIREASS